MNGLIGWSVTGAMTGVIAPLLLLIVRGWTKRISLSPVLVAATFVVLHGVITLSLLLDPPGALWIAEDLFLLAAGTLYWMPIIDPRGRLSGDMTLVYVLISSPFLDLAAVVVMAFGHPGDGIAMIVGMLPLNIVAVAMVWRWMRSDEERLSLTDTADALAKYNEHLRQLSDPPDSVNLP